MCDRSQVDIAVSAPQDDDGGTNRGAVHVLFLSPAGSVIGQSKISSGHGGLASDALSNGDQFGSGLAALGDLDGDGAPRRAALGLLLGWATCQTTASHPARAGARGRTMEAMGS